MKILAIDSAMNGCSAGVYDSDSSSILLEEILEITRGQAEHLMPMIDRVVKCVGEYSDIDAIAVTKGPGAFTGMRIGIATAKSLGLALNIPVIGISTFDAVLGSYLNLEEKPEHPFYGVLLETKRHDYYFKMFHGETLEPCCDAVAASAQDILLMINDKDCMFIGDACERFSNEVSSGDGKYFFSMDMATPLSIAYKACDVYKDSDGNFECNPVYLREPEIGSPKNIPRKLKV